MKKNFNTDGVHFHLEEDPEPNAWEYQYDPLLIHIDDGTHLKIESGVLNEKIFDRNLR